MTKFGRVLVTGASGFVGRHLCPALKTRAAQLLVCHQHEGTPAWAQDAGLDWATMEVTESDSVRGVVQGFQPDLVIHLAAQSHVPSAFDDPVGTWTTNTLGTMYLLEALRAESPDAVLIYISSGDIYGASFAPDTALDETALLQPANPYSASKAAADILVRQYGAQGLRTVCLRPFNHIGRGQGSAFVVATFARQIARVEAGLQQPVIEVGNLQAYRDFTDVGDVVEAYLACAETALAGDISPGAVFNVCSGEPRQIQTVLDDLLALAGADIEIQRDPKRLRPSDTPYAAGDATRLREATGWEPRIPWRETLTGILDDWRGRVDLTQ